MLSLRRCAAEALRVYVHSIMRRTRSLKSLTLHGHSSSEHHRFIIHRSLSKWLHSRVILTVREKLTREPTFETHSEAWTANSFHTPGEPVRIRARTQTDQGERSRRPEATTTGSPDDANVAGADFARIVTAKDLQCTADTLNKILARLAGLATRKAEGTCAPVR